MFTITILYWYFFFQAEDGIRVAQESRGLGDVYKRQVGDGASFNQSLERAGRVADFFELGELMCQDALNRLSLIHI